MQISSSDRVPHATNGSPTADVAPNSTGTAVQIFCVTVKVHTPFNVPGQVTVPWVIVGGPQQTVVVWPGIAKGVTVTGTQTDEA